MTTAFSISRILKGAIPTIIACASLAQGGSAMAQSAMSDVREGRCSNRTLSGDYGFTLEGILLGPNLPIRGVVMQHYDGKGNITQVDHVVVALDAPLVCRERPGQPPRYRNPLFRRGLMLALLDDHEWYEPMGSILADWPAEFED